MGNGYESIANDYDMSFQLLPIRRYVEAYSVLRLVGDVRGKDVLDLACGTGTYSRALKRAGAARVVGVDVTPAMIEVANGFEREVPLGIEYRVSDAVGLESLGSFDVVVAVYMLHYGPSADALRAMLEGVARNLKPGGRFVSFAMNPEVATAEGAYRSYGLELRTEDASTDGCPIHFSIRMGDIASPELTAYRWSKPTIESALAAAGLAEPLWQSPDVAPDGVAAHGDELWRPYLAQPHCVLLSCRRG